MENEFKLDLSNYSKNIFIENHTYDFNIISAVHMLLYDKVTKIYNIFLSNKTKYPIYIIDDKKYSINSFNLSLELKDIQSDTITLSDSCISVIGLFYSIVDYLYNYFKDNNIDFTNLSKYKYQEDEKLVEYFNALDGILSIYEYNNTPI